MQAKIRWRRCVALRKMFPREQLIRVVRLPGNEVKIDLTGKLPGRGAYITPSLEAIKLAQKRKALEHALRTSVSREIYEQLQALVGDKNGDRPQDSVP